MTITFTWEQALITLLILVAVIALCALIAVLLKLKKTLEKVDAILDDTKAVSGFAAEQTGKAENIINGLSESVGVVVSNLSASKGAIKNATSFMNAATSLIGIIRGKVENEKAPGNKIKK